MISKQITDSDMIILQSVESYLKTLHTPVIQNPQEKLIVTQQARDYLYSDIVQRVPRVAAYIMGADMETDTIAQGLYMALSKHVLDPVFVDILMQYLMKTNNAEENGIVGALLTKILNKHIESKTKPTSVPSPKKDKEKDKDADKKSAEPEKLDLSDVAHIQSAINCLLGNLADIIITRCGNLTRPEATAIAACIAMNNTETINEIVASDLPITAQLFDIVQDPSNLIKAALLLKKSDFVKMSKNQTTFMESLTRWVYDKLNIIPTQSSYQFLVATYGSIKPEVQNYYIQIKDCGMKYSNLYAVAKQLINQ